MFLKTLLCWSKNHTQKKLNVKKKKKSPSILKWIKKNIIVIWIIHEEVTQILEKDKLCELLNRTEVNAIE